MKNYIAVFLLTFGMAYAGDDISALEKRLASLEKEVATLRDENKKLKEDAFALLSAQLAERERLHARIIYRSSVIPMLTGLLSEERIKALPKEEDILTLADAYKPVFEMFKSLQ